MLKMEQLKPGLKISLPERSGTPARIVVVDDVGVQGVCVTNSVSGHTSFIRRDTWDVQYAKRAKLTPVEPVAPAVAKTAPPNMTAMEKRLSNVEKSLSIVTRMLEQLAKSATRISPREALPEERLNA